MLLTFILLPWYQLVAWRSVGPAAEQTLRLGAQYYAAQWAGMLAATGLILVLRRLLRPARWERAWGGARRWLVLPAATRIAFALAALATGLSLAISVLALNRRPLLLDGAAQLIQGRYLAAGRLAGPALPDPAFWDFQFMASTPAGWVSQYPPGFAMVLAVGLVAGITWVVGPLLHGVTVYLTTLIAERLFPQDRLTARLGSVLVAVSPFLAFHAGSYMNHVLAAALVALALFTSLRAVEGTWWWAVLPGAAIGALFATRPLVAVVLGFCATVLVWYGAPMPAPLGARAWGLRLAAAAGGAAPFVAAVMAYHAHGFGNPFRFGYLAVGGSTHGLGWHPDPFGNPYGVAEAVGYTSADLLGLSLDLLQTPLPVLVLIGLYLMQAPALERGVRLAAAWALLPVAGNALYWHHDLFMGPRLLYEAAPAWCLLTSAATLHLLRLAQPSLRTGVAVTFALALGVGIALAGPARVRGYATGGRESGVTLAAPAVHQPSLVFVHEDWESRLGARLAALGVRADSIRAALRSNTTCQLNQWVSALERSSGTGAPVRAPGPRTAPLRDLTMPSGSTIRTHPGEVLTPECEREAASDYAGVLALPPLLWQGDLPGLGTHGAMYVRDLGPERNVRLLAHAPERVPFVLVRTEGQPLRLLPYSVGMNQLWKQ